MYKWRLFLYVSLSILVSFSGLISPYIIGDFVDQLINAHDIGFIFNYLAIFAGINLATLVLGYISGRLYVQLQTNLGFSLNRDFIQRLQKAPINFTSQQNTAYLNQRINNDANALIIFCVGIIQNIFVNSVMVIVALVLLFSFHPSLAGILLVVAAIYFLFYAFYRHVLYKASHAYQESQSYFFSKLNEQMSSIRFIKIHSLFDHFIKRLNNSFDALLNNALIYQRKSYIFSGLDQLVMIAAQMILLLFGGIEVIAGRLTIGRFIIISSYFNIMLAAIRYFFSLGQTIQSNMVSYNRLQELVKIDPEFNGETSIEQIKNIKMDSVSFSYNEHIQLLSNINAEFTPGQIHIIVGSNGTGKSTLTDVLIGLQPVFKGRVLYNGVEMETLDMYDIRKRLIGVSDQESAMLADTLAGNIDLGRGYYREADENKITQLINILGLESYINSLPNGLDTHVSENAANISGGEKQKLSILRILLKNPDVLVLDEPTSALDSTSKFALRTYLNDMKASKIIIIITHDNDFIDKENDVILSLGTKFVKNRS